MKQGFIKTGAATPKVVVADCRANGEEILKLVHEMAEKHVKIMVFPELAITGCTCQDLFLHRRLIDSAWETLLWLVEETKEVDALIFAGLPMQHAGKYIMRQQYGVRGKFSDLCRKQCLQILEKAMNSVILHQVKVVFPMWNGMMKKFLSVQNFYLNVKKFQN